MLEKAKVIILFSSKKKSRKIKKKGLVFGLSNGMEIDNNKLSLPESFCSPSSAHPIHSFMLKLHV